MRKDITKKFLMRENRYVGTMLSKGVCDFIFMNKMNIDSKQISYDEIEFRNIFSTQFTKLNTKNLLKSGYKFREVVLKNGKSIEFDMIYCENGTFTTGSDNPKDKKPKREVKIERPFWLCETEVTQELYEFVMGYNLSYFKGKKDSSQRPVEMVSWYDAIDFCNKLSILMRKSPYYDIKIEKYDDNSKSIEKANVKTNKGANGFRLPLSKEWEYAAKAGTNNRWAGIDNESRLEEYAWFLKNSNKETHSVKQKKPNEWGFYDMSGNVWELCYDNDKYENSNQITNAYYQGGSRRSDNLKLYSIYEIKPNARVDDIGFRISMYL